MPSAFIRNTISHHHYRSRVRRGELSEQLLRLQSDVSQLKATSFALVSLQVMVIDNVLLAIARVGERVHAELAADHQIPSDFRVDLHQNHSAVASSWRVPAVVRERSSLSTLTIVIEVVLRPRILNALVIFSGHLSVLLQVFSVLEQTVRSGWRARQRVGIRSFARCR